MTLFFFRKPTLSQRLIELAQRVDFSDRTGTEHSEIPPKKAVQQWPWQQANSKLRYLCISLVLFFLYVYKGQFCQTMHFPAGAEQEVGFGGSAVTKIPLHFFPSPPPPPLPTSQKVRDVSYPLNFWKISLPPSHIFCIHLCITLSASFCV